MDDFLREQKRRLAKSTKFCHIGSTRYKSKDADGAPEYQEKPRK
jgi:hypothetical protein